MNGCTAHEADSARRSAGGGIECQPYTCHERPFSCLKWSAKTRTASKCCLVRISCLSSVCLIHVSCMRSPYLKFVSSAISELRKCQKLEACIRLHTRQAGGMRGRSHLSVVRCQTKENEPTQEKPTKIKEMAAPGGCVLCGGLKGPGAAPGAGDFKGTCERPGDAHEVRRTAPPAQPVGKAAPHESHRHDQSKWPPSGGHLLWRILRVSRRHLFALSHPV